METGGKNLQNVQRLTVDGVEIWTGEGDDGWWKLWSPTSKSLRLAKCRSLQEAKILALDVAIGRFKCKKHEEYLKSWQLRLYQLESISKSYMY